MPILFSAVATDRKIIAKYASCEGNFTEIADEVVKRIPSKKEKKTYSHGHYLLHYIHEDDKFYFCITDKSCQRSRAFLFLNQIKRKYRPKLERFSDVLADEMYRYSEDYSTIIIMKEDILGEKILYVNNPHNLRYRTVLDLNKNIQPSSVALISQNADEKMLQETKSENEVSKEYSRFYFYIILAGLLIVLWLAISTQGSVSFVGIALICVISIVKFHKGKHET